MIVKRFKLEDLQHISSASELYEALDVDWNDEELVGKKGYYKNFIIHPDTDQELVDILDRNSSKKGQMDWLAFAPVSDGPRYDEVVEACGRVIRNALYIVQPTDIIYEEAPDV